MTNTSCMDRNGALMLNTPFLPKVTSLVFFSGDRGGFNLANFQDAFDMSSPNMRTRSTSVSSMKDCTFEDTDSNALVARA